MRCGCRPLFEPAGRVLFECFRVSEARMAAIRGAFSACRRSPACTVRYLSRHIYHWLIIHQFTNVPEGFILSKLVNSSIPHNAIICQTYDSYVFIRVVWRPQKRFSGAEIYQTFNSRLANLSFREYKSF